MLKAALVRGFTLVELAVVVVLLGIILAIAFPSLSAMIINARLTAQANDLLADMILARSETASRGVRVAVCPTTNQTSCAANASDWASGRIVYVDADQSDSLSAGEIVLVTRSALSGESTLASAGFINLLSVAFNPFGGLLPLGTTGSFKLCSPYAPSGRQISVDMSGRAAVTRVACP